MDFATYIKNKYSWLSDEDISLIVNKAKMIYYGLRYPCDDILFEDDKPIHGFFEENWVLSACEEIVDRLGFNTAIGYKENGVSWTFDGAQISNRLCNLVKPIARVI